MIERMTSSMGAQNEHDGERYWMPIHDTSYNAMMFSVRSGDIESTNSVLLTTNEPDVTPSPGISRLRTCEGVPGPSEGAPMVEPGDSTWRVHTLRFASSWRLPDSAWARVQQALTLIEDAVDRRDEAGLQRGFGALTLCGPTRVATRMTARIETVPTSPTPDGVVELINRIVHALETPDEPDPAPDD